VVIGGEGKSTGAGFWIKPRLPEANIDETNNGK
jgi:hypothetical protein